MATELDRSVTLQLLADSTGFIIDRTTEPEKVIGQAWLISKGRVVTLASTVANYTDAPWALMVKFPHPDINYGVRTVTLHPDFNKREARDYYLQQAQGAMPPPIMDNDIATVGLEADLSPPAPEKISELNRALMVPFEISARDMSGTVRPGDMPAVLQSVCSTGRSGLLTFVDARNIPFARIAVRQTRLARAVYNNLYNEIALCELLYKQPSGSFAFQPIEYRWPADVPDIMTPPENIMVEGRRRADELPRIIEMLGGPEARFQKATPLADFSSINPNERWLAERLWECLDGFIPLSKIPERVGSDTYGAMKMVWDLATMGLLSVNQTPLFHGNGQLGPLLLPATELDLNTWEGLTSFHLDPLSGAIVGGQGNFFGAAHVLNNKTLLHTIPVSSGSHGAVILREGKLVGLHTGPYPLRGVSNPPPVPLQRMMWIGALNDLGTKRLRTTEVAAAEAADAAAAAIASGAASATTTYIDQTTSQRMSRSRAIAEPGTPEATLPPEEEKETGPLAKYSKNQIAGVSAAVFAVGLIMMISSMLMPHGSSDQSTQTTTQTETSASTTTSTAPADAGDAGAAAIAKELLDVNSPPDGFKFTDSTKLTDPKRSFGLVSEYKNVDITCVEWPNIVPLNNMDLVAKRTPVHGYFRLADTSNEFSGQAGQVYWVAGHYALPDSPPGTSVTVTVGVLKSKDPTKCIVFVAKPVSGDSLGDPVYPAQVVEQMISAAQKANGSYKAPAATTETPKEGAENPAQPAGEVASATDLAEYRKRLEAVIKNNYKPPHFELDTNTKVGFKFTVDENGQLTDLALDPPNPDDAFNQAIQRAVTLVKPFPPPPHTTSGKYSLLVRAHANDIKIEEQ